VSLLHRRSHDASAQDDALPEPHAAPAPAPPPSPEELEAVSALTTLRNQLKDGTLTQAEFDARRAQLGT